MAIHQLTVFVENKQGALVQITEALANANVDMRALSIADTQEFGILRLIVNNNEAATKALTDLGYIIKNIDVVGVKIGDAPGKLSKALDVLDKADINMEYLYAFLTRTEKHAYVVVRVADNAVAEAALTDAGFHIIHAGVKAIQIKRFTAFSAAALVHHDRVKAMLGQLPCNGKKTSPFRPFCLEAVDKDCQGISFTVSRYSGNRYQSIAV